MRSFSSIIGILFLPAALIAQEPAAVRKVVLPSLDSQTQARLLALDARLNPVRSPDVAAALVGHLATSLAPLTALTPIVSDPRNHDAWDQLAEDYHRLMLDAGDVLVTIKSEAPVGSAWTSTQVRRLCHQRLASLPRSSFEIYRQGVNAEAKALLDKGLGTRDPVPLRRIADELLTSRAGDRALDLLGDLAFERGQFDEARHWWTLLREFPDPKVDPVRVQAKQLLALIFEGRLDESRIEIDRFRKAHPSLQGDLAGEHGHYHKILDKTLATFQRERIEEPWLTFGGSPARQRALPVAFSRAFWEEGPAWRVKLPSMSAGKEALPDRGSLVRNIAFHPIIVNEQVLIADHRSVVSYHLKTGAEAFRYDLKAAGLRDPGPGIDAAIRAPRFTLSADHERVYARLGGLKIGPRKNGERDDVSYLVCLDLTEPGKNKPREVWHVKTSDDSFFEGAPLVHDGRVYVALTKIVDRSAVVSIRCYDTQGRLRWSRVVCETPEFEGNGPRHRQHLLTLAGGQIVYGSHAGAIVAVDAWTGQPTWAVRYSSRDHEPFLRDLAPCMYADGRVYVAPADSDRLLCIDAVSGQVSWEAEGLEVVHLLGVGYGRVLTATRSGLQTFAIANGRAEWMQPSEGRLPSLGRGLLVGRSLYWPTQDPLLSCRAVDLSDGLPVLDPTVLARLPAGNWACGHGCVAIAGGDELIVFLPPRYVPRDPQDRPHARKFGFRSGKAE